MGWTRLVHRSRDRPARLFLVVPLRHTAVIKQRTLLWLLLALLSFQGAAAATSPAVADLAFSLIGHSGKSVSDADFRGRFMLVFFGYTHCPDICPIGLQTLSQTMKLLDTDAAKLQPIFITIDPQRDTVEIMERYVRHFHPRLLGLTGTPEQIARVASSYRVRYSRFYYMAPPNDDKAEPEYSMDHTALMYLVGPDGGLMKAFEFGIPADELAAGIRLSMAKQSSQIGRFPLRAAGG